MINTFKRFSISYPLINTLTLFEYRFKFAEILVGTGTCLRRDMQNTGMFYCLEFFCNSLEKPLHSTGTYCTAWSQDCITCLLYFLIL
jgi:hypothetical protein